MSRPISLLLVLLAACAGTDPNDVSNTGLSDSAGSSGGTGVASTTTVGPTSTSTSGTTDPSTSTTGIDPDTTQGDGSDSSEGDGSSSSGGPDASWHRYTLDVATGVWTQVPLAELWAGANAPPPMGITATVSFTHFDRLFVVSEAGMLYERVDGLWQTPVPVGERFPAADGLAIDTMTHTPGQMGEDQEDIFLVDTPVAVVYTVFDNGGVELAQVADLVDDPEGAPQASVDNVWTFAITDPAGIGTDPNWLQWYMAFANAELWRFNAAFEWTLFNIFDNDFFTGARGEPDASDIRAAYHDDASGRAHFIAP